MKHRFVAFVTVGALGFLIQIATLVLLTRVGHWPYEPAIVVAVEVAILHNLWWHEHWTWRNRAMTTSPAVRLVRFHTSNGCLSLLGNLVATVVFVESFDLDVVSANAVGVVLTCLGNFLLAERWVFWSSSPIAKGPDNDPGCLEATPQRRRQNSGSGSVAVQTQSLGFDA
jgi:putative flippase GtrA